MKADLDAINNDIAQLQTRIDILSKKRDAAAADLALVETQRPAGIPLDWVAVYEGTGKFIKVTAWYDPNKFGSGFRVPSIG